MTIVDVADYESEIDQMEPPEWMSAREYLELAAICANYETIKRPTFLMRHHWAIHRRLVMRGFLKWETPHPAMGPKFAAVTPTDLGTQLIEDTAP